MVFRNPESKSKPNFEYSFNTNSRFKSLRFSSSFMNRSLVWSKRLQKLCRSRLDRFFFWIEGIPLVARNTDSLRPCLKASFLGREKDTRLL